MRFTTVFLTGALAAFASAQSTTASAAPAETSQQAAIAKCLAACEEGDVSCTSKCIAVPNPNEAQVNETTKCVAACPQGEGSAEDTAKYTDCVNDCIGKYYFTATGTPAAPTGGAGSGSGSGSGSNGGDGSSGNGGASGTQGDGAASGTATGTGSPAEKTGSGASGLVASSAGFLALVMGLVAL